MILLLAASCLRNGESRALADMEVGLAAADGMRVDIADGLAHVRDISPGALHIRASAPAFTVALTPEHDAIDEWILTVSNCMPDAVLSVGTPGLVPVIGLDSDHPTVRRWRLDLAAARDAGAGEEPIELRVAPPDASVTAEEDVWRFAVMADIQTALPEVHEVFERMSLDPTLRFVVSMGDLVERGDEEEYDLFERQLEHLPIPYYSTIGNHELRGDNARWLERFGRFNLHFRFKGVVFTLVDSGNASLDPIVYEWLDEWLDAAIDDVHLFFTHYPPRDPVGVRDGSFRSVSEASKLLARLARGNVDATFYGHIHSYYAFTNAGIPAYISGGGGAIPERWDGLGRHYLTVDVSTRAVEQVALVRVD